MMTLRDNTRASVTSPVFDFKAGAREHALQQNAQHGKRGHAACAALGIR